MRSTGREKAVARRESESHLSGWHPRVGVLAADGEARIAWALDRTVEDGV